MAFYTIDSNRITGHENIVAAEGYHGEIGAAQIALENIDNDMALFESLILTDFQEMTMVNESVSNEEIVALQEASVTGFIEKVKEFLKKVWEKIKGLIDSFVANLLNIVIRDNKKFVERYKGAVIKKDLSKMKYKWSKNKENRNSVFDGAIKSADSMNLEGSAFSKEIDFDNLYGKSEDEIEKTKRNVIDIKESELGKLLGVRNKKIEFSTAFKAYRETFYDDVDTHEGLNKNLRDAIIDELVAGKDTVKKFKDLKTKSNKRYNDNLKELNKAERAFLSMTKEDKINPARDKLGSKYGSIDKPTKAAKVVNTMYTIVKVEQEVVVKAISVAMQLVKWKIKECRSVFARAAAYRGVNETVYMSGLDDEAFHDLEELFEGIYSY